MEKGDVKEKGGVEEKAKKEGSGWQDFGCLGLVAEPICSILAACIIVCDCKYSEVLAGEQL